MPKQKRDYDKIKMEFMLSDFDDVKWFLSDSWVIYNSKRTTITKWRTKEKKEFKRRIYEQALKEKWEETAKEISDNVWRYEMLNEDMLERMEKQMEEDRRPAQKWEKKRKLNSNDIMNMRKISRTERWLPTNISKVDWNIKNERAELTDDEKEALDVLMWKSQDKQKSNK